VTDVISEVVLGSFWLMLPGLGHNQSIVITISQKTVIDYDYPMSAYNWPIGLKYIIFILDVKCSWTVVSNQWCVYHSLPVNTSSTWGIPWENEPVPRHFW